MAGRFKDRRLEIEFEFSLSRRGCDGRNVSSDLLALPAPLKFVARTYDWCIFDNTAARAAMDNVLALKASR